MLSGPNGAERINVFALVAYISDPLRSFLVDLRRDLEPAAGPVRPHVTVLPPRPLAGPAEDACGQLEQGTRLIPGFEIELAVVEVFATTSVLYLGIGSGRDELVHLHQILNADGLAYQAPYPYAPHITLAQSLALDQVDEAFHLASSRWAEFRQGRGFRVTELTFVQNTVQNDWLDLAIFPLRPPPTAP